VNTIPTAADSSAGSLVASVGSPIRTVCLFNGTGSVVKVNHQTNAGSAPTAVNFSLEPSVGLCTPVQAGMIYGKRVYIWTPGGATSTGRVTGYVD
jgi:hypothetical protein